MASAREQGFDNQVQEPVSTTQVTIDFADSTSEVKIPNPDSQVPSNLNALPGHAHASLASFLERPVKIQEFTWAHGGSIATSFEPFTDFLTNPMVASKIENFYLFRGNLHLRFQVNGMPFHLGRAIGGFYPLHAAATLNTPAAFGLMKLSQLPAFVELNPTTNTTAEVELPFFSPNTHVTVPGYPISNLENLGKFFINTISTLSTSNGNVVPATISVWAWATDVELVVPTTMQSSITKSKNEQEPDRQVSKISSAVAASLSQLSNIPVIGPFATAGSMVATTFGNIASLFGYSRPPVITDPMFMKNQPLSVLAHVDGNETVSILSLDPKHEITIDPRSTGLCGDDEMAFQRFFDQWTYVGKTSWLSSNVAGDLIGTARVEPMATEDGAVSPTFWVSPLTLLAMNFEYWRGSLEFRFDFVCSAYHTGRVRIIYEPGSTFTALNNENVTYSWIVDINENTSITIMVPWSQPTPYRKTGLPSNGIRPLFDASGTQTYSLANQNGRLLVEVLNPLRAPAVTSNINVICYARAGPDLSFGCPTSGLRQISTYAQSAVMPPEGNVDFKPLVHMGEQPTSIRQLIKRYTHYWSFTDQVDITKDLFQATFSTGSFPTPRGPDAAADGLNTNGLAVVTNYVATHPMSIFRGCYAGWRGGIKWKFSASGNCATNIQGMTALRQNANANFSGGNGMGIYNYDYGSAAGTGNTWSFDRSDANLSFQGSHATTGYVQPTLEVQAPWYNPYKFAPSCLSYFLDSNTAIGDNTHTLNTTCSWVGSTVPRSGTSNSTITGLDVYVAAGDDMSYFYFVGTPAIVYADPGVP